MPVAERCAGDPGKSSVRQPYILGKEVIEFCVTNRKLTLLRPYLLGHQGSAISIT
jgi:hypothetical protein